MAFATVFHDLALLVDKTGRLPRNFSSRKINLPSLAQVIPFLKMSMKLLDIAITVYIHMSSSSMILVENFFFFFFFFLGSHVLRDGATAHDPLR